MRYIAAARKNDRIPSLDLIGAIAELKGEFLRIQSELVEARDEIERLKKELNAPRPLAKLVADLDVASLRRRVAFYCHPDRGGDNDLMTTLNALLDLFEDERSQVRQPQDIREGSAVL